MSPRREAPNNRGPVTIPRTQAQARRAGLEEITINFRELSEEEKSHWVFFPPPGKSLKKGALAAMRPASAPITRTFPGPRDGVWYVCYYTAEGAELGCHKVYSDNPP